MKPGARLALLVCALGALLTLPCAADAKPGYYVSQPGLFGVLNLPGSSGYEVNVVVYNASVAISAQNGGTSVSYSVRGRTGDDFIAASFGDHGRIAVRPPLQAQPLKGRPGCKGRPGAVYRGRFVGTIRFVGEDGVPRVRAKRAKGFLIQSPRLVCKLGPGETRTHFPPFPPAASLGAISGGYSRTTWFSVSKGLPTQPGAATAIDEEASFAAHSVERRQGMSIHRSAYATASPATFRISPLGQAPVVATAEPPPPFEGTAVYKRNPGGADNWSGDLRVDLPGIGEVALADSSYEAKLCRRNFACACPAGACGAIVVSTSGLGRIAPTAAAPTPSPWRWPGSPR